MTVLKYLDLEGLAKYDDLLKSYIDTKLDTYLPLSGGTMTGAINSMDILPKSNLTYNLGSSTKSYNKLYARYIDTPSNYDLRFMAGGAEYMRIAASNGALVPNNTGTIDIGTSTYKFRNIYGTLRGNADTATTASSLPEAKLTWGGKNFAASWGPIDAAMIPELGSNRLEYYPGSKIKIEYSTDNGTTWTDSGWEDKHKTQIFSTGRSVHLGGSEETGIDKSQYRTRITLTTASTVYSKLNKFAIRVSTTGSSNCWCTIDVRLQQNVENNVNTWKNIVENVPISGWSGWNIINTEEFTTYGNQPATQYGEIRFTFGATHPSTSNNKGLIVSRIKGFGGEGWTTPSNKALTGTVYTEQYDQSTIWPANLLPSSNKTIDLGTDARYWRNIYGTTIYENGTSLTSKYQAKGNYAGSSSAGGAANSVANKITVKLNSGTTEGTNLFTYNGSAAKTINITPISIGASALYNVYSISPGEGTKYYKLLSITPTTNAYGDMHYEFDVAGRNNIRGGIKIFIRTANNKKYISTISIKYSGNIGNNVKAYKYRDETSETDTVELWMKVESYDTLKIFPKTHYVYSTLPVIWSDFAASTQFPTDFTEEITISFEGHDYNSLYKQIQTEVSDPVSSGSTISFIDTISQNTQGKITVTKKTISWITDDEISSLWNE